MKEPPPTVDRSPSLAAGPAPAGAVDIDIDVARWEALAHAALVAEGADSSVELSLTFVDEAEMAELNQTHMGHAGPTDVLSFPMDYADGVEYGAAAGEVPPMAGDIVICPAVARRNAPTHAGTLDDELALLVVHGVLHLVGHDHAEVGERTSMQARERALLADLHGPLAADPWRSEHTNGASS